MKKTIICAVAGCLAVLGYISTLDTSSGTKITEGLYVEIGPDNNIIDNAVFADIDNYFSDTEIESEAVTEAVTTHVQAPETQSAVRSAETTVSQTQAATIVSIADKPTSTANKSSGISVTVPKEEETVGNLVWVPTKGGKKYHSKILL